MSNRSKNFLSDRFLILLPILIILGFAGNYFSYPFGFGVDFLFGSIFVLLVVGLYDVKWAALASLIASSYTIILWQHPYALIIFVCEALFVAWRIKRGQQNILTSDMYFWVCIGIPLVLVFYGLILRVGLITTTIIALKQPVNGIFNALIAGLILNTQPVYRLANFPTRKTSIFFEQLLLKLLVAFVLIPALILMVVNNRVSLKHEQTALINTLDTSAQNLAMDLQRWHKSGLEALRYIAENSSRSNIVVSGQTQHGLELAIGSLPLFKDTYIINADRDIIAQALFSEKSARQQLDFSELDLPRIPQIFVLPPSNPNGKESEPIILQTLPIILDNRWLGNIIAELNIDFIEQLLQTEADSTSLESTLLDKNNLLIASTDKESNPLEKLNSSMGKITNVETANSQRKIYHWLPFLEDKPLIARWRKSFYAEELEINEEIPLVLRMEVPAAPYIDYLQLLYIRSLAILLFIALASILIAKNLSHYLVKPILSLAGFTNNLPEKILRNEQIKLPRSSVIEMNALINNFEVMSNTIETNIQDIQQTNKELKTAQEESEVAIKAKNQFLANISHELKTPLNSIIGYSNLIEKNLPSDKNKVDKQSKTATWIENIQNNGKYLLTLINEILDLAETQANKTKLYPSLVDTSRFIQDIVAFNNHKAAQKNILFNFETIGEIPPNIYVDEQKIRQILLNLLHNAFKFTKEGQITLQIVELNRIDNTDYFANSAYSKLKTSQVHLRFQVIDTGIGINNKNLATIFQPFEQINRYETNEIGTGLGLSISKQLVELMGGQLKVKSKLGKGSIFSFDLTLPAIKTTSELEAQSVKEIVGYKGSRMTVLIVDDVKTSRLLLSDILKPLGFNVLIAKDGQQGLEMAIVNKPDLILTDLFMPIKTGFTLIAQLRQNDNFAETPIIAASASSFDEVERQSRASGCNDFLPKPLDDRRLLNIIGKHLNIVWIYSYDEDISLDNLTESDKSPAS